jgi:hypothetical protein
MWFRDDPSKDDAVDIVIELAKTDWVDIGTLSGKAGRRIGSDAPVETIAAAIGELAGILIDHDVVPGDLGADPDFAPWPGTRDERVARIVAETLALGRYPLPTEICWFEHRPGSSANAPAGESQDRDGGE